MYISKSPCHEFRFSISFPFLFFLSIPNALYHCTALYHHSTITATHIAHAHHHALSLSPCLGGPFSLPRKEGQRSNCITQYVYQKRQARLTKQNNTAQSTTETRRQESRCSLGTQLCSHLIQCNLLSFPNASIHVYILCITIYHPKTMTSLLSTTTAFYVLFPRNKPSNRIGNFGLWVHTKPK